MVRAIESKLLSEIERICGGRHCEVLKVSCRSEEALLRMVMMVEEGAAKKIAKLAAEFMAKVKISKGLTRYEDEIGMMEFVAMSPDALLPAGILVAYRE